ncbi:MAG TPA: HdeD family acid-resistance protein [Ktedonobacteraceae bacterium]|nr:HdeD family acid-resistance protein [Ktedonobacteraceae bacterium]
MEMMARPTYGRHWWALLIRGIIAILFGIAAIVWPGMTVIVLVALFGAFALVDGIFAVVAAIGERGHDNWGWLLIGGLVGIIIGIITFFWPAITALILLDIIAIWAILMGIFYLTVVFAYHQSVGREILLVIMALLSFIFAAILLIHPVASLLALVWVIGVYAIIVGIMWIIRAFRFRALVHA